MWGLEVDLKCLPTLEYITVFYTKSTASVNMLDEFCILVTCVLYLRLNILICLRKFCNVVSDFDDYVVILEASCFNSCRFGCGLVKIWLEWPLGEQSTRFSERKRNSNHV